MTETAIAAAYDALIRAHHARHVHAIACREKNHCHDCARLHNASLAARETYEELVLGKKAFRLPNPETTDLKFLRKQAD